MSAGRVFLTGAGGFIGNALAERFRADGWEVGGVDLVADPEHGIVAGDTSEPGTWQEAVSGCDLVVHTAALVSNVVPLERAWEVNVCGTSHVLDAAAEAGVRRVVVFSSLAVYSHHREGEVDEHRPVRPTGDVYNGTKIATEQVALQAHVEGRTAVTILRPGDVYGPRSRPWTILPVEMLRSGLVVLPANGRGIFVPIFVDDLVDFVLLASESEAASGEIFNVTGGPGVETREFFGHYCRMLGIKGPRTAPTPVAVALAEASGRALRAIGRPSEATAATMRMLAATGDVSIDKARRILGWEPRIDLDEGMRRTEAWLRSEGFLS
ncbi:MAG: NAD-dependent epimerase/dehydratase family protein [Acidimicrobiia bacterium]|nr:NAD-dependent epimerase/dehydratase family protein [Acidimicrobiia bacterium]